MQSMLNRSSCFSFCVAVVLTGTAASAQAGLRANFFEGAPKDRFQIRNESGCVLKDAEVLVDLSTSSAGLIFDVTDRGAGVEVYQPLEMVAGSKALTNIPNVEDGQSSIRLKVAELEPGEAIAFTIDVDDTLGTRAITVSGAEIAGASVSIMQDGSSSSGVFTERAEVTLPVAGCDI
ncbi:MAG: aggregation factor core [Pseudomonadota bacterium]